MQALPNHHPQWANAANDAGPLPAGQPMAGLTLVLARPAAQQAAFEQFLADQQNPASANYHHWLTAAEIGERFGPSDADVAAIKGWLQSEGLQVSWVAPSKTFIGFGGTAAGIAGAFQTELHNYPRQRQESDLGFFRPDDAASIGAGDQSDSRSLHN